MSTRTIAHTLVAGLLAGTMVYVGMGLLMKCQAKPAENPQENGPRTKPSTPTVDVKSTPRETFRNYFQAMDAGQREVANALKTPDSKDRLHMDLRKLKVFDRTRPFYELSTSNRALVVAHPYTILRTVLDREEVIYAVLRKQTGAWRIQELNRTAPEHASWLMKGFQCHSEASLDLSTDALVGEWRAVCASTIVLRADGTGSEFRAGPVAPPPDQKPEPFRWSVNGATLSRRFRDRTDQLIVTTIDHKGVHFKTPNTAHWYGWRRKALE